MYLYPKGDWGPNERIILGEHEGYHIKTLWEGGPLCWFDYLVFKGGWWGTNNPYEIEADKHALIILP